MSVELYLDLEALEKAVTLLADPQLDKVADSIGSVLISSTAQRIANQKESPEGMAWPNWGGRYAKTRKRSQSLLVSSGDLKDSIHALVTGGGFNTQVVVGTSAIYAATHQFGASERGIPARPFLGISNEDRTRIEHLVVDALEDLL